MSNQHRTNISPRSAKQSCLADRGISGRVLSSLLMVLVFSTGFTATAVYAADGQRTRAQAVEIAKSRSGDGRVLSVKKKMDNNGVSIFAVKIIVNGRVKVYSIREFTN